MFKLRPTVASSVKAVSITDMCYERILDAFTSTSFKYKNQEVLTWRHFSLVLLYPSLFAFLDVTRHKPSIKLLVHQLRKLLPRNWGSFFLAYSFSNVRNIRVLVLTSRRLETFQMLQWNTVLFGCYSLLSVELTQRRIHEEPITRIIHLENWVCSQHSIVAQRLFLPIRSALPAQKEESFIQWNDFVL